MSPRRAMVMAAGLGTRMRPLTDDRCKALVEVAGRALIDWTLDKLVLAGVETAVVNVHHFADRLEAHLAERARTQGPAIMISDERGALLETGGGLVKAAPLLGDAPVFVANIDALWVDGTEAELTRLARAYDPDRMDALLMLADMERTIGMSGAKGDFAFCSEADSRIDRASKHPGHEPWLFSGLQILHPRVLAGRLVERFSTNRIWDEMRAAGRLHGHTMQASWMHVGDPQAVDAAENRLQS